MATLCNKPVHRVCGAVGNNVVPTAQTGCKTGPQPPKTVWVHWNGICDSKIHPKSTSQLKSKKSIDTVSSVHQALGFPPTLLQLDDTSNVQKSSPPSQIPVPGTDKELYSYSQIKEMYSDAKTLQTYCPHRLHYTRWNDYAMFVSAQTTEDGRNRRRVQCRRCGPIRPDFFL